ncbi:MAG: 6-phosphogluconate dehydrogenase related protein [Betaproteobacteria bacterium]|nr:6-phosphogluconate dehydrogenase related protein [Betaproteobacteria bacterium]
MTSFALIGLGRMGANMARRLALGGVRAAVYDQNPETTAAVAKGIGGQAATSLADLVEKTQSPRVVWIMLPSGDITEGAISQMQSLLSEGDVLVDGGNSMYKDSMRRAATLKRNGLHFVDAGVSGGVHGLANGYCIMAGGDDDAMDRVKPYLRILAPTPDTGWLHSGPAGSGHFVKMVHNGIEYGMMQALAEGFAVMGAKKEFDLDLAGIGELWRHSSVVRSWLLDLTAEALADPKGIDAIEPVVADSGEGRWTAVEAIDLGVPAPVMSLALMMRFASQGKNDFANKLLAKMRQGFGGHAVVKK